MIRAISPLVLPLLALGSAAPLVAVDGDLDPGFASGGRFLQAYNGWALARAVAALPDGRLYLGGHYDDHTTTRLNLHRLLANGQPDTGWSGDGIVQIFVDLGTHSRASVLGVHPLADGRLLLSGYAARDTSRDTPILVRLLADGEPDPAFAPAGVRLLELFGENLSVYDSARAPDGRILFAGTCGSCDDGRVFVLRTTAAGDFDPSFGSGGWAFFYGDPGQSHFDLQVAVDPDGRPVVAGHLGSGTHELYVARLTADGDLDDGFGEGGVAYVDYPAYGLPGELAIDPVDGRIFVAANGFQSSTDTAGVIAITPTGELDGTFGFAGIAALTLEEGTTLAALLLQSDGKLVAGGSIDANGSNRGGFFLARLTRSGALDPTFHHNGVVRHEFDRVPDGPDGALALTLSAGRIVAAGEAGDDEYDPAVAALRLESALVFADDFERGTTGGWNAH